MSLIQIAIAGDLHSEWGEEDNSILEKLNPDAVLFVGDLSDGDLKIVKCIKQLSIPTAVILGNHDTGRDSTGETLQGQTNLLGELNCGWRLISWENPRISIAGARPCSPGGGYFISKAVESVYGPVTLEESSRRIVEACTQAATEYPLIILAHSGPTGLGSEINSPCGRDWKPPSIDWGDKDLAMAINNLRKIRKPELVVFGHMHHLLKRGKGYRFSFVRDAWGIPYLNAACVPRRGQDEKMRNLSHFSWVEFTDNKLSYVGHRWYLKDGSLVYQEKLLC